MFWGGTSPKTRTNDRGPAETEGNVAVSDERIQCQSTCKNKKPQPISTSRDTFRSEIENSGSCKLFLGANSPTPAPTAARHPLRHQERHRRLPCTERVEIVSGVGTPGGPSRAPLWHLWTTITCAAPPRVPTQHQPKDFDARRRLESRCPGIPCAPRKCTRVFFRLLVGDQPQLLNRAHDAAPGPPSLSSPQPNKSRLNTCHGFFHSAQRCLSRWGPAPTEAVASIGREAAQTGPGRACQHGSITQD